MTQSHKFSEELLALNAIDKVIKTWSKECDNLKGDDVSTCSSVIADDIADAQAIYRGILNGATLGITISRIMNLDTAPRDEILEAMKAAGLRAEIEATGLVQFVDKPTKDDWLTWPVVRQAIKSVQETGNARILFVEDKLVAILAGAQLGMYEVHVGSNAKKVESGSK